MGYKYYDNEHDDDDDYDYDYVELQVESFENNELNELSLARFELSC